MRIQGRMMRGRLVALIGTLGLSLALGGAAAADQPRDAWITTKVKIQLLTDDLVDGTEVNVDTVDGRVTLHGKVATEGAKRRAVDLARGVDGVGDVRDLLAVVPPAMRQSTERDDEELGDQVSTVLDRDKALEDSDIRVESVNDGVVLLAGRAANLDDHRRALEDVRSVDGVERVASEVKTPE
ncbi:MAG: BON domain-containing protein [Myxococcota bacterium]